MGYQYLARLWKVAETDTYSPNDESDVGEEHGDQSSTTRPSTTEKKREIGVRQP
jgi:hypothetical protein